MVEVLTEYGLFLAKSVTVAAAVLAVVAGTLSLASRARRESRGRIRVEHLNRRYEQMTLALQSALLPHKAFKALHRDRRQAARRPGGGRRRVFVLDFHGDPFASAVESLRQEITAVLSVAAAGDEVVLRLESGGGLVHAYGLAAAQLLRIKDQGVPLTVAVDKVAASGGYMMACVADRLIAAPFAVIGAIGVLAQVPNFHRLLKKHDIDFELYKAGEHKRTVTYFGENTPEQRAKFQEHLQDTHQLFKDFVKSRRSGLDIEAVATGEYWFGSRAVERGLVDELCTSDAWLLAASAKADLYRVRYVSHKPMVRRLLALGTRLLHRAYAPLP